MDQSFPGPGLLLPGTSMSSTVCIAQMLYLVKKNLRLVFHDPKLTDPVIHMNLRVAYCVNRHEPLVMISTVGTVDYPLVIRLNDTEILKRGTSWHHMRLISFRKLHRNAQWDQPELSLLQRDLLCRAQINPIGFTVYISQFVYFVRKIFNLYRLQAVLLLCADFYSFLILRNCSAFNAIKFIQNTVPDMAQPSASLSRPMLYAASSLVSAVQYRHCGICLLQASSHINHSLVRASPPAKLRVLKFPFKFSIDQDIHILQK